MTVATWILAIATVALALEGGAALKGWFDHLRLGRTKRELEQIKREISLIHHAAWMGVTTAGQGNQNEVNEKIQRMLRFDGWTPDTGFMEQAGYFDLRRIQEDPGEWG